MLFVAVVLFFIFGLNYYPEKFSLPSTSTATPSLNAVDFDLFGNDLTTDRQLNEKIKIRIINASGKVDETNRMKNILIQAGFQVEQTTVTDTTYNQTTIYYRNEDKTRAEQVEDALATSYNTKIEESINLGASYNILVIIGQ